MFQILLHYFQRKYLEAFMNLRFRNSYDPIEIKKPELLSDRDNVGSKASGLYSTPMKDKGNYNPNSTINFGSTGSSFNTFQPKSPKRQSNLNLNSSFRYTSPPVKESPGTGNPLQYGSTFKGEPQQKVDNYLSGGFPEKKTSFYGNDISMTNYKDNSKSSHNDLNTLSWTKYISMEFKNEELENKVAGQQAELKSKSDKIEELQKVINLERQRNQKELQNVERNYLKQIADQRKAYQAEINKKDKQINDLANKLVDQTKQCIASEIKEYLTEITGKCAEMEIEHKSHKEKLAQLEATMARLEQKQQITDEEQIKRCQTITRLGYEISSVANKILCQRSGYSSQSANLLEVIQAQSAQISEQRTSFQQLQAEYLKLRGTAVEVTNKLNNYQSEQKILSVKNKSELNALLVELGFILTQKQNENNCLKRKLATMDRKYKLVFEEHKFKIDNVESILSSRKNEGYADIQALKTAIARLRLENHCESCLQTGQELEIVKQKLHLFVN